VRIKLKDVKYSKPYEETFGTCEFCMSTSTTRDEILVFETDSGETAEVSNHWWSWGDRFEYLDVDNWAEFSQWLGSKEWDFSKKEFVNDLAGAMSEISQEWMLHLHP